MLLEFRVKNFRSFGDEQVLSMIAVGRDKSLPESHLPFNNFRVLKAAGVFGANASGKSNLIKAMDAMCRIVLTSAKETPKRGLRVTPFLFEPHYRSEPTELEVTFVHEGIRYQYGFAATQEEIVREWLFAFPRGSAQKWFERQGPNPEDWKFGGYLKGEKTALRERTRPDALFVSVAAQWNHEQLTKVYEWFKNHLRVVGIAYPWPPVTEEMLRHERREGDRSQFVETVLVMLRKADFGIDDVTVEEVDVDVERVKFPEGIPPERRADLLERLRAHPFLDVRFRHGDQYLPLEEESDGTQRFFQLMGPFLAALSQGFTVFFDELQAHLHPLLTRELVRFFQGEQNKQGAQLVFTSHDVTLLDPELLRRDQIWLTEKSSKGMTELYSLAEYKRPGGRARRNEAFLKNYLAGKYGAVPFLEPFSVNG